MEFELELEFEFELAVVDSASAVSAVSGSVDSAVTLDEALAPVEVPVGSGPVDPGPVVTVVAPPATQMPPSQW